MSSSLCLRKERACEWVYLPIVLHTPSLASIKNVSSGFSSIEWWEGIEVIKFPNIQSPNERVTANISAWHKCFFLHCHNKYSEKRQYQEIYLTVLLTRFLEINPPAAMIRWLSLFNWGRCSVERTIGVLPRLKVMTRM